MYTFKVYYRNSRTKLIRSLELEYDVPWDELDLNSLWKSVFNLSLKVLEPHEVLINIKLLSAKEYNENE